MSSSATAPEPEALTRAAPRRQSRIRTAGAFHEPARTKPHSANAAHADARMQIRIRPGKHHPQQSIDRAQDQQARATHENNKLPTHRTNNSNATTIAPINHLQIQRTCPGICRCYRAPARAPVATRRHARQTPAAASIDRPFRYDSTAARHHGGSATAPVLAAAAVEAPSAGAPPPPRPPPPPAPPSPPKESLMNDKKMQLPTLT
jgi:hypothetical protein